jgi:hypothetical protein
MITNNPEQNFGCEECWHEDASLAYEAFRALKIDSYLIDESHYIVTMRHCLHCSQKFLTVFTETVDYLDGDDPQYRIIIPLTTDESEKLIHTGDSILSKDLESVGTKRRSLRWDHPKGANASVYWDIGIQVRHHD